MLILAPVVFLVLLFIPAPYGRFSRRGWGPSVNQRVGWFIMSTALSFTLFKYVSCPNYLGEIIQWAGWALLTMSPAGLVFLIWTIANLAPRALAHHRWYKETFQDYPDERKALLPGLF